MFLSLNQCLNASMLECLNASISIFTKPIILQFSHSSILAFSYSLILSFTTNHLVQIFYINYLNIFSAYLRQACLVKCEQVFKFNFNIVNITK